MARARNIFLKAGSAGILLFEINRVLGDDVGVCSVLTVLCTRVSWL